MIGSEMRPIEMTEAATVPVVAPSTAPTKIDRVGQAAAHVAEQLAESFEQILGHAASFEYQCPSA